jgi:hypothetical protein
MSIVKLSMRLAAVLVTAATALSTGGGSAAYASGAVPWTDTAVTGAIGLCDSSGHAIEGGNVNTTPFVWRAVSSTAAPSPYNAAGRTATLYAFQPRQGVAPGDWSGDMLTSSTRYTNPAHPMTEATGGDLSLAGFIGEFPPAWNGLLQLRMYLSAPNQPADSLSYPATTIKVTGSTWSVVNGGTGPCTAGSAESIESIVLPKKDTKVHHTAGPTAPATTGPSAAATKQPAAAGPSPAASSDTGSLDAASTSSDSGSSTNPLEIVIIAVLAAAAGGAAVTWRGRRKNRSTP